MTNSKKLTRREFARAMKLGHGRALLHVRDYGDDRIEQEIKDALLKSYSYNVPFDGLRTRWVQKIVILTGRLRFYGEFLLQNLDHKSQSNYDLAQRFDLASFFFDNCNTKFRKPTLSIFTRMADAPGMSYFGCSAVDVAGRAGLELVARTCGAKPDSADTWECSQVLKHAIGIEGKTKVTAHMREIGNSDEHVMSFMKICEEFGTDSSPPFNKTVERPKPTLDELLLALEKGEHGRFFPKFRSFGRYATEEDLRRVLDLLKAESDKRRTQAFLTVFQMRELPEICSVVIDLLRVKNQHIRSLAAAALSNTKSDDVREEGLNLLRTGRGFEIQLGLDLLKHNYVPEDARIIGNTVKRLRSPEHIHRAGQNVDNLCDTSGGAELAEVMIWFYENGPESFCKARFLERLIEWRVCPEEILYEAQWDAGDDVQEVARASCDALCASVDRNTEFR